MRSWTKLVAAAVVALGVVGAGTAVAQSHGERDGALARDLTVLDRNAAWTKISALKLRFPTYHPEGLVVTTDRYYLSSTEIIEPTVKYPTLVGGYDRSPGKGIGHLFVIAKDGRLLKDIHLGHGIVYHPGGIDTDGRSVWVPVAQYRPNSTAEMFRVDLRTLRVSYQFGVDDHIGGLVVDKSTGHLVGNNWGSRRFYDWTMRGRQLDTWANPQNLLDFQDCQYVAGAKMACGGITGLPQTPTAGGATAAYELGGIALLDLRRHTLINAVPFQYWSAAGHVMTRNPVKLVADGRTLTLWAAPDNGEEIAGTQIYTYRTTLASG